MSDSPDRDMEIQVWIRDGNEGLAEEVGTVKGLLERAGRALDNVCSGEIMGEILFVGIDGKVYVGSVEFDIREASAEYVHAIVREEEYAELFGNYPSRVLRQEGDRVQQADDLRDRPGVQGGPAGGKDGMG